MVASGSRPSESTSGGGCTSFRFRQLLHWPRVGLGWPLWVEAPSFDIAEHVGVFPVAPPGTDTQLLLACEELRRRPLKRSRPLWEMWFLPGLSEGRVGLFMRLHHAIADGVAGVAVLGAFVDTTAEPREATAPAWAPASMPSRRTLLADNVRRRLHGTGHALSALAAPINTVQRVQQGWPALREIFAEGRAPQTSFNRRIGSDRRLALIRNNLDLAKEIAHAHGATINDVLLTAAAGGYRTLLESRGGTGQRPRLAGLRSDIASPGAAWSSTRQRRRGDGCASSDRRSR